MNKQDFAKGEQLLDYFISLFEEKFNRRPDINRFQAKYRASDVVKDLSLNKAKELVDYYFHVKKKPDFNHFVYNYNDLLKAKERRDKDREKREQLRERTRKRMEGNQ